MASVGGQELLVTGITESTMIGYVVSAHDGGGTNAWLGSGITSSDAKTTPATYAVGYAVDCLHGI